MAVFNTFTFDGENSLDYGVYITGEAVYNAPERAVEMVSIPGKNGALALDQGRFENIEVTYPAGTFGAEQAEFAGRMRAMRNMLASRYNYVRLTDSYHPDEYRLGLYKSGLEASPVAMSSAGEFDITFNCKPQRFLTSGEEPVDTSELGGEVTTNRDPYLFRQSGGGNIGHDFDAEIDKIIGGTVAWNQLVQNGNFADTSAWNAGFGTLTVSGNVGTYKITSVGTESYDNRISQTAYAKAGHVYYSALTHKESKTGLRVYFTPWALSVPINVASSTNWVRSEGLYKETIDKNWWGIRLQNGDSNRAVDDSIQIKNAIVIDLTQAFGSTIADYIYLLEQGTSGSGIAKLKEWGFLTKDYFPYSTDSLQSVKTSAHKTTGANRFDKSNCIASYSGVTITETSTGIRVATTGEATYTGANYFNNSFLAGKTYTVSFDLVCNTVNDAARIGFRKISNNVFISPPITAGTNGHYKFTVTVSEPCYLSFLANYSNTVTGDYTFNNVMVVESSSEASYEPYVEHTYALDSDLELRGIPKLDSNNALYYDGDTYESSGSVSRLYKKYTSATVHTDEYGTLGSGVPYYGIILSNASDKIAESNTKNIISNLGYVALDNGETSVSGGFRAYAENEFIFYDTRFTSKAVAQQMLDSLEIVYIAKTPTTEQADPYANLQLVNPFGTEEYIDTRDVPVPVGHETKYGMSQLVLSNPTEFPSKPLLEVTGVGTFWLGDTLFTITGTAGQTIYIDCETGEAWKNAGGVITPANGLVTLNRLDFPELDPGDTPVMYGTGITKVVVTPRWWII